MPNKTPHPIRRPYASPELTIYALELGDFIQASPEPNRKWTMPNSMEAPDMDVVDLD